MTRDAGTGAGAARRARAPKGRQEEESGKANERPAKAEAGKQAPEEAQKPPAKKKASREAASRAPRRPNSRAAQSKGKPAPPIDKARVLELLAAKPGATKRDLARLLGLKGSDRIVLKRILKELEAEGAIEGNRKRGFTRPGELPEVGRARNQRRRIPTANCWRGPQRWDIERGTAADLCHAAQGRRRARDAASASWRGCRKAGDSYEARVIQRLERQRRIACSACCAMSGHGRARLRRSTERARTEFSVDTARPRRAPRTTSWCWPNPSPGAPRGFARVRGGRAHRQHGCAQGHQPDRHPRPRHPDRVSQEPCWTRPRRAAPADPRGRTDLRAIPLVTIDPDDARDHDDAVWAGPDDDPTIRAAMSCWSPSPTSPITSRRARRWTREAL